MATRRKAVTRSRITTRSSKAKQPAEQATTASQTSTITNTNTNTNTTTTTRLIVLSSSSSSSEPCSASSPVKKYSVEIKNEEDGCWSTPKAKRFRIPEIESCPPAPKKQRVACDDASINCSMRRRSSIPFFTPPELADFFFRVSVPNMSAA